MILNQGRLDIKLYLLTFGVASAWFFSNVNIQGVKLNIAFTLLTIIACLPLARPRDYMVLIFVAGAIFFSSITGALNEKYFINYCYKIFSLFPVVILVRRASASIIFLASVHSFVLSTLIAIILLALGLAHDTFILYPDLVPRFAGLAIEPVSYALGAVVIYIFYILSFGLPTIKIKIIFYLPAILAVSSVILLKLAIDFLITRKRYLFFFVFPLIFIIFLLIENTRVGESIDVRIFQYTTILRDTDFVFFGSGFYLYEPSKQLPGLLRVYFELGLASVLLLLIAYAYFSIKLKNHRYPFLFVGMLLPVVLEGYGAPFLWVASVFCLLRGSHCLNEKPLKN